MFAAMSVALALAITPPQDAVAYPGWEHVLPEGWEFQGVGDDSLMFTRPARQPRHIWVRHEKRVKSNGVRSIRVLTEVDCDGWRTRAVQIAYFPDANLEGASDNSGPLSWTMPGPETLGESVLVAACGE